MRIESLFTKISFMRQDDNIEDSIRMLSKLLYKHYGQKVVILIDEYDVPLDRLFRMATTRGDGFLSHQGGLSGRRSRPMSFYSLRCSRAAFACQRRAFYRAQ